MFRTVILVLACLAFPSGQVTAQSPDVPEPLAAFSFDEGEGPVLRGYGRLRTVLTLDAPEGHPVPRLGPDGSGVSGLPGDRAIDTREATGMGGDLRRTLRGGFARIDPIPELDGLRSFTFQGWFKTSPDTPLVPYTRILHWPGGYSLFAAGQTSRDRGQLRLTSGPSRFDSAAAYSRTDEWTFFAVVVDPEGEPGNPVRFFLGNRHQPVREIDTAGTAWAEPGATRGPMLLANWAAGTRPFQGWLDNLRWFGDPEGREGALSPDQLEVLRRADARQPVISGSARFFHASQGSPHLDPERLALYQAHLYGDFSLTFEDLTPGRYRVEAGNAEFLDRPGFRREFDIVANGDRVIEALDLAGQFGVGREAVVEFPAHVDDSGVLRIDFVRRPGRNEARLSHLRVLDEAGRLAREYRALDDRPDAWTPGAHGGVAPRSLETPDSAAQPPWEGAYRIRPDELDRLTAADLPGPDGVVYPDWRRAGVPGGIPEHPVTHRFGDFDPPEVGDVSAALQAAVDRIGEEGGGVLWIEPGDYELRHPILITRNHVVLRGAGPDATRFRWAFGPDSGELHLYALLPGPRFAPHDPNAGLPRNAGLLAYAPSEGLASLAIHAHGERLVSRSGEYVTRIGDSGISVAPGVLHERLGPGEHALVLSATFTDGRPPQEETFLVRVLDEEHEGWVYVPRYHNQLAAFLFLGEGVTGTARRLAQDGRRGDTRLVLEDSLLPFREGDTLQLEAPPTARWNALVRNGRPRGGTYRQYQFFVTAVEGATVDVNQPLRLDYPVIDGSFVEPIRVLRGGGIESLSIEQTRPLWINAVTFSYAWESWGRDLVLRQAGRHAFHIHSSKFCQVEDSLFDATWFVDGGGTAYVGFERSYDCLMQRIETRRMRHAPNVQWAASGNVIRDSRFVGSDGQWHAGWTSENLYENNVIESGTETGGYGFGLYASAVDTEHGPQGPRNVVYNNDLSSPGTGLWMGGMNEAWIILHNRFVIGEGMAVSGKDASFDHLIRGNVFAIRRPSGTPIWIATADCIGWTVEENRFYGVSGRLTGGLGRADLRDNTTDPAFRVPERPQPEVPSIFEWQRTHRPLAPDRSGWRFGGDLWFRGRT